MATDQDVVDDIIQALNIFDEASEYGRLAGVVKSHMNRLNQNGNLRRLKTLMGK